MPTINNQHLVNVMQRTLDAVNTEPPDVTFIAAAHLVFRHCRIGQGSNAYDSCSDEALVWVCEGAGK